MKSNNIDYYKGLEYNIIVEKQELDGEKWYIAYIREFGKMAFYGKGETHEKALCDFLEGKNAFIEYLYKSGRDIPEPQQLIDENYSGFFNVRTSPIIHASLVFQAKEQNISLNAYLNQLLSAGIERANSDNCIINKLNELFVKLEEHHYEVTRRLSYKKIEYDQESNFSNYSLPDLKIA